MTLFPLFLKSQPEFQREKGSLFGKKQSSRLLIGEQESEAKSMGVGGVIGSFTPGKLLRVWNLHEISRHSENICSPTTTIRGERNEN